MASYQTSEVPIILPEMWGQTAKKNAAVITDTHDQPETHWIALWTDDQTCTAMHSFTIPLPMYEAHTLLDWLLTDHFEGCESNHYAMKAVDSQSCGLFRAHGFSTQERWRNLGHLSSGHFQSSWFSQVRLSGRAMVPTFGGRQFDLASLQTVSTSKLCPCSIVSHGYVAIKKH